MNFVLIEFTIRRRKKEWDSGALKSFARYSSLGEGYQQLPSMGAGGQRQGGTRGQCLHRLLTDEG